MKLKPFTVPGPPADIQEGKFYFKDGFILPLVLFLHWPASYSKCDDEKYTHNVVQNLDIVEKSLKIASRDIL